MHSRFFSFPSEPSSAVFSVPAQALARNFRGRRSYRKSYRIPVAADPFRKKSTRDRVSATKMYATCKEWFLIKKTPA